jgi:tRNA (guanine37-N1)-methyltransferase
VRIDIISAIPALLDSFLNQSILKKAQEKNVVELVVHDLRDFSNNKHNQIDDYAFGGGAGMVLMPEPLFLCVESLQKERTYDAVIYVTPDGKSFNQKTANSLSLLQNIIIICGHYKGIDERVREKLVTHEFTIGDYVLSGGELPAAIISDAIIRLIPGVLSDETSALTDSFQDDLLAPPVYTRPADFRGMKVPDILTSGHEANIEQWRFDQAVNRTKTRRPDLFNKFKNNN